MGKKAFVTGGTGFVGSHLVDELLRRDYEEVRCLVRKDPKWLAGKDVQFVSGDLNHENVLKAALRDVTHVFHVAALTRARDGKTLLRTNVEGTIHLLRAIRTSGARLQRVVITSSLSVVGSVDDRIATEETPLNPVSVYGKSKALMESRLREKDSDGRAFTDALPITVIRPPSVYGPREKDIFTFFRTANRGVCPVIGGNGSGPISLVYVEDLVRGMIDAAESPETVGETYFLGPEDVSSWEQVREATSSALGRKIITISVPPGLVRLAGVTAEATMGMFGIYPPLNREKAREIVEACKACSSKKAKREFGYRAGVSLEEGISRTIHWYRQEGWLS